VLNVRLPLLVCVAAALSCASASAATVVPFSYTGSEQTFIVPANVTSLHIVAVAGKGGAGRDFGFGSGPGGFGATATADVVVSSGENLFIEVGGNGGDGFAATGTGTGGFNGGGSAPATSRTGGGGGGASDVRTVSASDSATTLASRLLIAGGGGGGGVQTAATGGAGGGLSGGVGAPAASGISGGGGGTQSAGGGIGNCGGQTAATAGTLGNGGNGGSGTTTGDGGGGGGGLYGGGGGGQLCGGGGGSGYFGPGTSNGSFGADTTGVPSVTISYAVNPAISIASPTAHTYVQNQVVDASYTCTPAAGTTLVSCSGSVANGAAIDTSTLGSHTFIVTGVDADGGTAHSTATYAVVSQPPPPPQKLVLSAFTQSRPRWRPSGGTVFRFKLNHAARVTLTFTRHAAGRRVRHRCVAQTRRNRHKPKCSYSVPVGRIVLAGSAGLNQLSFSGKVSGGRRLRAGRYTVAIIATDAAGRPSGPLRLAFTIQ
jgi:hypothetical protein